MKTEKDEAMRRERMRLIDADKLLQDIKDYHLSDGMFQHWVEVQPIIEDRPARRWVPLTEALPEDGTWNLFTDGQRISLERYKQDAEDHFYPAGRYFDLTEAVAWMELPKEAWTLPEPREGTNR